MSQSHKNALNTVFPSRVVLFDLISSNIHELVTQIPQDISAIMIINGFTLYFIVRASHLTSVYGAQTYRT